MGTTSRLGAGQGSTSFPPSQKAAPTSAAPRSTERCRETKGSDSWTTRACRMERWRRSGMTTPLSPRATAQLEIMPQTPRVWPRAKGRKESAAPWRATARTAAVMRLVATVQRPRTTTRSSRKSPSCSMFGTQ